MILGYRHLARVSLKLLPFADAGSAGLPLPRLLRLSLFQVSVGMTTVLLMGTLNRVMIVELGVPAFLVAIMAALPVLLAPLRAILGFRSDHHRSAIGWRRVPYIWFGTLYAFAGLAIMPFALLVLSGDNMLDQDWMGVAGAALAFLLVGLGVHTTQTAGLALAADLADDETRPRVVALLWVMLLLGMMLSSLVYGWVLRDFTPLALIQAIQGTAAVVFLLNLVALWKQERMRPMSRAEREAPKPSFRAAARTFFRGGMAGRLLVGVALGTAAFAMQDVLLEPYGGEILGLSVSATTALTALWAFGSLVGFGLSARFLARGMDPIMLAGIGLLAGVAAFVAVIFSEPLGSPALFAAGAWMIGLGAGLFGVAKLIATMMLAERSLAGAGLALGAWGAVQALAAGIATGVGGSIRDLVTHLAARGWFGPALDKPSIGYMAVYHIEIALLFATLIAIGPLVRRVSAHNNRKERRFGLTEFPA
jgi:BCD family chlorophyll transporter-like MFS transporter